MSFISDLQSKFNQMRENAKLKAPGSFENLHLEIRGMLPANYLIEGAKFDLSSHHNENFQTTHSFGWGSSQVPSNYHFGAAFANARLMMHGQIDNSGTLQARGNYNWIIDESTEEPKKPKTNSTSKLVAQLSQKKEASMISLEHEYQGLDFNLSAKTQNLNPFDKPPSWSKHPSATGNFVFSYLQAISSSLAVGAEWTLSRPYPDMFETSTAYALKWAPEPTELPAPLSLPPGAQSPYMPINPQDPTQVFTATFLPANSLFQLSYWRRINQRLEVGAEMQGLIQPSTIQEYGRREAISTIGFKLDTVFATIRSALESSGKLSMVLEEKVTPNMSFQINGEIDYLKSAAGRVGFGFTFGQ